MDTQTTDRLREIARLAVAMETGTGVPARLLIAQWAIESRWGAKPVGQYNVFGIKRSARHAKFVDIATREVVAGSDQHVRVEFADYDSLEDACRDYAWLISQGSPYRAAWKQYQQDRDLNRLIDGVAQVYATDPGYARLLKQIAGQQNIAAWIEAAQRAN